MARMLLSLRLMEMRALVFIWWDEINESSQWQDNIFYSLCAAYALVSSVALVQLIRIELRVPEYGWTTQKVFHLMNFIVNGERAIVFGFHKRVFLLHPKLSVVGRYAFGSDWEMHTWHTALPDTQMPKSLRSKLQSAKPGQGQKNAIILNEMLRQGSAFPTAGKDSYASSPGPPHGKRTVVPEDVTTFFTEKDLHSGKKMKLYFPETTTQANLYFLPRQEAETIPFSTKSFPEILKRYSVKPESAEAKIMKQTIEDCEEKSIKGEVKYCATSLESLIDFSVSRLGKQVKVHTTELNDIKETKQSYVIQKKGVENLGNRLVVCHKQNYVYAVFYCHEVEATTAYSVSLVGNDGTAAKAVAVCHTDTRYWSAQHYAFQVLKAKPGTVSICHFLPSDNLVWVSS